MFKGHKAAPELFTAQREYRDAVDDWVGAIRTEENLAFLHPSVAQLDEWKHAYFAEEDARKAADRARRGYEDAVRQSLFGF